MRLPNNVQRDGRAITHKWVWLRTGPGVRLRLYLRIYHHFWNGESVSWTIAPMIAYRPRKKT